MRIALIALLALGLAACEPEISGGEPAAAPEPPATPGGPTVPEAPKKVIGGVDLSQPVNLVGTEPFWSVKVDGATMTYSSPEASGKPYPLETTKIVNSKAELAGGGLSVTLTAGTCSDGMSDRVYPLTAVVKLDGKTLNGCAISAAEMAQTKP
ncbi:COG3650 family protein [Asticcacaulis sp. AC402]|uniref:COG3650 family protein n=1 Tax=Asticcacaulis sp. AC402 TaxID=1282361 RepID=UPI0003C3D2AD|nr:hypothetical protein [Asticcacaulis sp. AC402]ESQ74458.1 hypothetical protein ABAC402_14160 [Asticcacaulis sp. AC402]